ncbi:hypothetical protein WKR88_17165 [Trinickia caryophylli]|uniref:Short chain dehydrogenase n=1 Tax=Trinickia caryophylli TaxID=28094 RepID=A0A1X7G3V3_TRICW|nr:hypothetical protein [Trinickia caryophylli]WQE14038.1 hypothetical protein U0034_25400 [Trinickia caryophylli]GLU33473.1 hypothetical protein Busp01_33150 [Trinickia caryophylli]SMF62993.1 hypothetical protein SAMN06295900_11358 [Trinickia caryophylli]
MSNMHGRLRFITGMSSDVGHALPQAAFAEGHRVVGTLRDDAARGEFELLKLGPTPWAS